MSGHSKWSKIRDKKGASDAKRGKLFTQLGRAITVAARKGGGDVEFNNSLRSACEKAKSLNMPNDNIERAIKRGTGEAEGVEIIEARYEGYGPGGTAFIIDALTDNSNRTVADLRLAFSKHGGNLEGSVAWQFEQKGIIIIAGQSDKADDEEWVLNAIEAGVDDVQTEEGDLILLTQMSDLQPVKTWLEESGLTTESAELQMVAKNTLAVEPGVMNKINKILDTLDENDDVANVFHNVELT